MTTTAKGRIGTLAGRLKRLREDAGLTRTALAEPRYTVSYVSQIEAGRRTPSSEAVAYLADRLGTTPGYLSTGIPEGVDAEIAYGLEDARAALRAGRTDEALARARDERARADEYGLGPLSAQARIVQANALFLGSRYREAIDAYEEALELTELDERSRGLTVNALASAYRTVGDLAYAVDVVESYLRARRAQPMDPSVRAELQSTLVSIYFERGDVTRAEQASERALAATEDGVTPEVRANALWAASRVLAERNRWDEALDIATRARIIIEELADQRRRARMHTAHAFLCLEAEPPRLDEASSHLEKAASLYDEHAPDEEMAYLLAERCRLALLEGRPDVALEHSTHALDRTGVDELERARCLFLQGRSYAALGNHAKASGCFHEAAAVFSKRGARQQEASCWREIGEQQLTAGDAARAIESLRAGLEALDPRRSRA